MRRGRNNNNNASNSNNNGYHSNNNSELNAVLAASINTAKHDNKRARLAVAGESAAKAAEEAIPGFIELMHVSQPALRPLVIKYVQLDALLNYLRQSRMNVSANMNTAHKNIGRLLQGNNSGATKNIDIEAYFEAYPDLASLVAADPVVQAVTAEYEALLAEEEAAAAKANANAAAKANANAAAKANANAAAAAKANANAAAAAAQRIKNLNAQRKAAFEARFGSKKPNGP